jgi:hypothetical protein
MGPREEGGMFNLPTDNLYKFVAIFGLIIALFSIYYPFQKYHELRLLLIENEGESELFKFHESYLEGRTKFIEGRLETENDTREKTTTR